MLTQEVRRQFFATQKKPLHTVKMEGKAIKLANFPTEERRKILDKLKDNDPVMALGDQGILPGIKINGKQVTKDNIHEFELKPKVKEIKEEPKVLEPEKEEAKEKAEPKYTKESLTQIAKEKGITGLREIGDELGVKFRSIKEGIGEILDFIKKGG